MATAVAESGVRATVADQVRKRPYVIVFAILAIVTFLELNVGTFIAAKATQIGILVSLATLKASLVVAYYMHLRYEPRWLALIPFGALALVAVLVVALAGRGSSP